MFENANLRGAAFMILSMAGFAVEDMLLKTASRVMPIGQAVLIVGLCGMAVFALMARRMREPVFHPALLTRGLAIRSGFEVSGRLFYALAIALTPLSTTSAILQASPLVVVGGAALFFGERVGWRRWLAVVVGFVGVLIIIRPGLDGFSALSLLAVAGMLGFAGRDLATRAAPKVMSNRQLGVAGFAMLALAGAAILAFTGGAVLPDAKGVALLAGTALFAVLGYHALTSAMRTGEIGFVTPFRYVRLVFAMALAMLLFGERPDLATWLGSALVVGSGIYTLIRGNRQKTRPLTNPATRLPQ
ncbi:MAG: DMT family transporter [Pseudotabrizicola sp.]|uniref:DMT family transporter n=1 Tax=Pseudotabrizicola sp. TaxID=2939647 RepID=UPI0027303CC5|nr:DMT family transporter [Pseudotabrizicola sp.]MDP2082296.1 DMT family transporter [Pseudotabrizicola sp.]MDZ7575216.1 DMT family transporter [Pseudotabrizicola sp.]